MKKLSVLSILIVAIGCADHSYPPRITATTHGWKTDRVVANRYKSDVMGETIGLTFPKDPYDCDRAEIGDLIAGFGGIIYQGGGSPGTEMLAVFQGVHDRKGADSKIKEILPDLTFLVRHLNEPTWK